MTSTALPLTLKLAEKLFGRTWSLLYRTVKILVGYMDNRSAPGKEASVWSNMLRPFSTSQSWIRERWQPHLVSVIWLF